MGQKIFDNLLSQYLRQVIPANTERTKSQLFLEFIRRAFEGVNADCVESLFPDLEKYVRYKEGSVVVKGAIDALLGNLIVEFERNLDRKLSEAENQLRKYVSILWSKEGKHRTNYMCMASDGIYFNVYKPRTFIEIGEMVLENDVILDPIDKINLSTTSTNEIYLWLDRYLLTPQLKVILADEFVGDFGSKSPLFNSILKELSTYWEHIKESSEIRTLYDEWARYLRIVYGSEIESDELFFKHTYLATLAKLMAYMSFSGGVLPSSAEIIQIINGEAFRNLGIHNVFEEDYFSWIVRQPVQEFGLKLIYYILDVLARYDLSSLDEDVLKTLYQELVDPAERHDLGEYYTPDWIAEYMLEEVLGDNPKGRILDPACGSGTFLFSALRLKKKVVKLDNSILLEHLIENVVGVDVHPLAVIVSKANYLLAISDIINTRRRNIYIPVYLADSIRLPDVRHPTIRMGIPISFYEFDARDQKIRIPSILIEKLPGYILDAIIDYLRICATNITKEKRMFNKEGFKNGLFYKLPILKPIIKKNGDAIIDLLYESMISFVNLIEEKKDTIWAFIIKNNYKPLFLRESFDIVIGNPPWLSYRYVGDPDYQRFLKRLITEIYRLTSKAELMTHMELATLFFVQCSRIYLKDNGMVYFVMPRSIFSADQHQIFRENSEGVGIVKLVDLKNVEPLFNIPSCLIKGIKNKKTNYSTVYGEKISGKFKKKNIKLEELQNKISITKVQYYLNYVGARSWISDNKFITSKSRSYYYKSVFEGSATYPRPFWFIDIEDDHKFGLTPTKPPVRTSNRASKRATKDWKNLMLRGTIEAEFIYSVITSTEIVSFGYLDPRIAILPLDPNSEKLKIVRAKDVERTGYQGMAEWLRTCESEWIERRGAKEKYDIYEWLNFRNKLTRQNQNIKYKVVYPASATYLISCVIDLNKFYSLNKDKIIPSKNLIIDDTNYYYETNNKSEAYYLCSILNSKLIDELIKPMQAKGLYGARHIRKKPLEFPIHKFNIDNPDHVAVSTLGKKSNNVVYKKLPNILNNYNVDIITPQHVSRIRKDVKYIINDILDEIDEITAGIFSSSGIKKLDQYR